MTRAHTLTLALLMLHFLLGVLCIAVARGERPSRALRLWGWGLLAYAGGALLTVAAGLLPYDFKQVAGNALICFGGLVASDAILAHADSAWDRRWAAAGLAACVAALVANHALDFALIVDIGVPTVFASLLFAVATFRLVRSPPPASRAPVHFLAVALLLTVVLWNARLWAIFETLGGGWEANRADLVVSMFAIGQVLAVVAATLGFMWIEVRQMGAELERLALTDMLTGLPNRRAMRLRFDDELARARRGQQAFAIALLDLDRFKRINDAHGHLAGDAVLAWTADRLAMTKRGADVVGRIGGEEFLAILPELGRAGAVSAVERLRAAVGSVTLAREGATLNTTLSAGLAVFPDDGGDWDRLFSAADRRLYAAKRGGRDRLVADDASQS